MRGYMTLAVAAALFGALPAHADDCATVMTAMVNQASRAYSATMTLTDQTGTHTSKIVFTGSTIYTQVDGQWHSMPMSSKDMIDQIHDAAKTAKTSCHQAGSEAVNGQPTTIYAAHVDNQDSVSDNRIWVSKTNGLALKSEVVIKDGPHMMTVFDYAKVVPPAGATPFVPPPKH